MKANALKEQMNIYILLLMLLALSRCVTADSQALFVVIALNMSTHVYVIRDSHTSASTKVLPALVVRIGVRVRVMC